MSDKPEFVNATYWVDVRPFGSSRYRAAYRMDGKQLTYGRWVRSYLEAEKQAIMWCWRMGARTEEMEKA